MPWCEECSKYLTPNSVSEDGICPACGAIVNLPETDEEAARREDEKSPWHFKLLVGLVVVYLGWRLIQLVT